MSTRDAIPSPSINASDKLPQHGNIIEKPTLELNTSLDYINLQLHSAL